MADVTRTAADVRPLPGATIASFNAGGALTLGDAVYVAADGDVEAADADAALSSYAIGIVVAIEGGKTTAAAGNRVDIALPGSRVTGYSGLTPGVLMYSSVTAGRIADARPAGASGDFAYVIGIAVSATTILVMPFSDILTAL
jgi:hypothetical protein